MKLSEVRQYAMGLGDVTEAPHHNFSSFRIAGKIFVTVPPDQVHLHVFTAEEVREKALAMYPEFIEKLLWGGKVVGVRVALSSAEPNAVRSLVRAAFEHKCRPGASGRSSGAPTPNQAAAPRRRKP